jgi:hypothetical protein
MVVRKEPITCWLDCSTHYLIHTNYLSHDYTSHISLFTLSVVAVSSSNSSAWMWNLSTSALISRISFHVKGIGRRFGVFGLMSTRLVHLVVAEEAGAFLLRD